MAPPYIITGVPKTGPGPSPNPPPPRLEIRDFVKDPVQFSLYVQALTTFQDKKGDELLSYYKISGIHGKPNVAWNEAPPPTGLWYCHHSTELFPTWHRPYMALFEQLINAIATDFAETYTVRKDEFKKAAVNLRQPYWDWALNTIPPDEVLKLEYVTIIKPDGKEDKNYANPFLKYKFQGLDMTKPFDSPFKEWQATLRYPTSFLPDAQSSVSMFVDKMTAIQDQIRKSTARLFSITKWSEFSTKAASAGGTANSLESVHDSIHNNSGGGGHMSVVAVAAFDPIFYLHHVQVDRLLTLWAAIHWEQWVSEGRLKEDLTPFWSSSSGFWNSEAAHDFNGLNYSYPEFQNLFKSDPDTISREITKAVKALYGDPTSFIGNVPSRSSDGLEVFEPSEGDYVEWTVRVQYKQHEVGDSFSVFFFLTRGEIPQNPQAWHQHERFIGTADAFVNNEPEACANCQEQLDELVESYVHLNVGILRHSGQISLHENVVGPYLKENLRWAVQKVDRTVIEIPSLKVVVLKTPVSLGIGAQLPVAGEPVHYHDITA